MLNELQIERYSRQISLPGFGEYGQQKLLSAKVLVIGAGGLGCPVLQYLAAMGVGHIGIVDDDVVSLSNLHRQVLFNTGNVGNYKANVAAEKLALVNPDVQFSVYDYRLTNANAWEIISGYDIVIDGSDNFETRYMVNDACVLMDKPFVHGSIFQFEGQVAVFNYQGSVNYRNLFAEPPNRGQVPNCEEAGVLGVLPGIIGNLMANEAIKIITGKGDLLTDCMLTYNSLQNTFYEIAIAKDKQTASGIPTSREAFENMDYGFNCEISTEDLEIDSDSFNKLIGTKMAIAIDIREIHETPFVDEFEHKKIPMEKLMENIRGITSNTIVLFCQTGKRSRMAVDKLKNHLREKQNIFSLQGGILQWKKEKNKQKL